MAKKAYVGVNGVARKVKKMYVGVSGRNLFDKALLYATGNCSVSNGTVIQTVADTATAPYWRWRVTKTDGTYTDYGQTYTINGVISTSFVKDSTASTLNFGLNGSVRDTTITYDISSLPNGTYTVSAQMLNSTQGSVSWNNMRFVLEDSVAFKVKKAYVGIGGVARPCWGGGEVAYYGKVEDLTSWPDMSTSSGYAATIGDYALFAGFWGYAGVVEAYNSSLIKSSPTGTGQYGLGGTGVSASKHAFLANGLRTGGNRYGDVAAYDASLTRTVATSLDSSVSGIRGASIGEYALFAGGYKTSGSISSWYNTDIVTDYDSSLTKSIRKALSVGRSKTGTATVGNYAIFAGGYDDVKSKSLATVDAFDASLTRTIPAVLSSAIDDCPATTVGNYAIFAIGTFANAYNTSLTRSIPTVLSVSRSGVAATTVSEFALFAGGSTPSSVVDVYDTSLTRTTTTKLSVARGNMTGATVGNYALFAGGSYYNDYYEETTEYTTVDVYTVV